MVTVVAPDTFQFSVTDCLELIISGLAVKELITGGDMGGGAIGGGDSSGIIIQPVVKPASKIINRARRQYLSRCIFLFISFSTSFISLIIHGTKPGIKMFLSNYSA